MITQSDLDLIPDEQAFNPPPSLADDPAFRVLNAVCWALLVLITVTFTILLWRIK